VLLPSLNGISRSRHRLPLNIPKKPMRPCDLDGTVPSLKEIMSDDALFYSPNRPPPAPRQPKRGEKLFEFIVLFVAAIVSIACSTTTPTPARTLTGQWPLSVAASPSCRDVLPFGYGVAPRGGGRASLVQSGSMLTGTLYIFDTPSGTIEGTISSGTVQFRFNLSGRNVGVLKPGDEPCHVVGDATGTTDGRCYVSAKIAGEFSCPYSCVATDHILIFQAGRGCS
jgi:hypothetical protein